jgi:hypothetical protein
MRDLTDNYQALYPLAVKAEQKEKNVLILYRTEEPRPFDLDKKKIAAFERKDGITGSSESGNAVGGSFTSMGSPIPVTCAGRITIGPASGCLRGINGERKPENNRPIFLGLNRKEELNHVL